MKHRALTILLVLIICLSLVSCRRQSDSESESSGGETASTATNGAPVSAPEETGEDSSDTGGSPGADESEEPSGASQEDDEQPDAAEANSDDTEIPPESELADKEFSFQIGSLSLTLRESGIEEKLAELPFEFISDTTEELGEGSDTFAGSYLKTVKYTGFEMLMFAPRDNKDRFWVMQMTAAEPGIYTYRGVQAGDTLEKLMEKYPEAELVSTDSESVIYRYMEGEFEELSFVMSDDTVSQISLTYYMP